MDKVFFENILCLSEENFEEIWKDVDKNVRRRFIEKGIGKWPMREAYLWMSEQYAKEVFKAVFVRIE